MQCQEQTNNPTKDEIKEIKEKTKMLGRGKMREEDSKGMVFKFIENLDLI